MLEAIKNRRSIRKFKDDEVPKHMIEERSYSPVYLPPPLKMVSPGNLWSFPEMLRQTW